MNENPIEKTANTEKFLDLNSKELCAVSLAALTAYGALFFQGDSPRANASLPLHEPETQQPISIEDINQIISRLKTQIDELDRIDSFRNDIYIQMERNGDIKLDTDLKALRHGIDLIIQLIQAKKTIWEEVQLVLQPSSFVLDRTSVLLDFASQLKNLDQEIKNLSQDKENRREAISKQYRQKVEESTSCQ